MNNTPALPENGTAMIPANSSHEDGFGVQRFAMQAETAALAVAAQSRAAVESRYVMAMRNPRDWDVVRQRVLADCKRSGFAMTARYRKPIGGQAIEGWSIRFAEAAMRAMTNVLVEVSVIYDDADKRIIRVSVTDLEANLSYPVDVTVEKTVERSRADGREVIRSRKNSKGYTTYVVRAEEDDLLNKINALVSKAIRTCGLRLIPGDILDDALRQVQQTLAHEDRQDPAAARKRLIDSFGDLGVTAADLKAYVGRDLAQLAPADMSMLRDIYSAIKTGEARWSDYLEQKAAPPSKPSDPKQTKADPLGAALDKSAANYLDGVDTAGL